jgi:hypothetical protein
MQKVYENHPFNYYIKLNRKFTINNMTFNLKILLIKTFSNYYFLGLRVTP